MAKKKEFVIPMEEAKMAAEYFTISNMAVLDLMQPNMSLSQNYDNIDGIMESECGVGMDGEYRSWVKIIAKGDKYCFEEWNKVKHKYIKA